MRRLAGSGALFLCALAVGACGLLPGGAAVRLENMSNSPVVVDVNGTWAGTYAGGTSGDVYVTRYGRPPFTVTVRTPDGLIAAQVEVAAADLEADAKGSGGVSARAEFPCGTIQLSFGQPVEPLRAVAVAGLPPCS